MSTDEMQQLARAVKEVLREELKPISEKVEIIEREVVKHTKILGEHSKVLGEHSKSLRSHSELLSENAKEVKSIKGELKSVSEQVAVLTVKVDGEIIPALEAHTKILKKMVVQDGRDADNIDRLDRRLSVAEAELGIHPPVEHHLVK